jgi:hypothetical protein
MMMGLPFIFSVVLPLLKIRDKDPLSKLSSADLTKVSPSSSIVSPAHK